jgi:hypothetical protein
VLRSLPPSQDYQAPPDTALLRNAFPQLLGNFSEAEAVKLISLGLRDVHALDCAQHGLKKSSSTAASQLNPVDPVFRMAADMSGCFSSARVFVFASQLHAAHEGKPAPLCNTGVAAESQSAALWCFRRAAVGAAALVVVLCTISFFKRRQK